MVSFSTNLLWRFGNWFEIIEWTHQWSYNEGKSCIKFSQRNSWSFSKYFGPQNAAGTDGKIIYYLNVRNTKEQITEQKPFLKSHQSIDDIRFAWLDELWNYFNYAKIQLKKWMMLFKVIMQSQKSLFRDAVMNDCKSLFFISNKDMSFVLTSYSIDSVRKISSIFSW